VVPDDGNLFLDVPDAPQDRPTSPGPVPDPQQTLSPSPLYQRLAAAEQLHMFDLFPMKI